MEGAPPPSVPTHPAPPLHPSHSRACHSLARPSRSGSKHHYSHSQDQLSLTFHLRTMVCGARANTNVLPPPSALKRVKESLVDLA